MAYQVVDSYESDHAVQLDGRSYPATCLVEDVDGIRLLLIADDRVIPATTWLQAYSAGAQAILRVSPLSYVLASVFMEERAERGFGNLAGYVLPESYWVPCSGPLSYVQMVTLPRDLPSMGFVHLHTHSEHSALDGVSTVDEIIDAAVADGQKAVAITDHGLCSGHPVLQLAARKKNIKPIFGMEAYFVDDRHVRGKEHRYDYQHLTLWAMDDAGLRNLWAMSTESYREGLYDKPRLDWDTLERLNEGVMAATACLRGPLLHPWLNGDTDRALANLSRLRAIFRDRLYIELHANHVPEQIRGNHWLVEVAQEYNVPLIAVVDSHYPQPEDKDTHRVWLSITTEKDIQDDSSLFAGGHDYHVMTEAEVRTALNYLPDDVVEEAIVNTGRVAARCTAEMNPKEHNPVYSRVTAEHPDPVQHDIDRLLDLVMERWDERTGGKREPQSTYLARGERELGLIIQKGFPGYFLMNYDLVSHAKKGGILVGPGRGSGGGSLIAYIIGITEIDPVEADLLFERFMTEGRTALPDFDIDFPSSKKEFMLDYVSERWGNDHIAIVGTHIRLKNKGAINDTARAMKSVLPTTAFMDLKEVSTLIDAAEASTAGLGLSWEDLWAEHGDLLEPYREKYPELFDMATRLRGRLRTYSKHAAGVIIDPDEQLTGTLPLWCNSDSTYMVTQFDKDVLEELGYIKFDMLNIRNLDTIQGTVDLIHEKTGRWVNPYNWREEYEDPYVWTEIGDGWTLGIFQIETTAGTRLAKRFKPQSVAELADVITLVRPGPVRSGLTETYFRRRAGDEAVSFADSRLESVLAKTYGTMLYQEDIMATCMVLAAYGSDEADEVRKILGKKKVEKVVEAGRKFVRRAVENGTDETVAILLWEQMAEFAKYSFNRAHAFAYAIIGIWTAWLKFHYPVQFLCAALSSVKQERIPDFVAEARRMGYQVLPPDVNESNLGFTATQMAVRYGLMSISGIGDGSAAAIIEARPYTDWDDFQKRKGAKCNNGHVKILARIGAFDSLVSNRRGLEMLLEENAVPGAEKCINRSPELNLINLPCSYDWENEPQEIGRSGKPKKRRDPPKKCTRACRRFEERSSLDPATVAPYTDEDIRRIEMEYLGVYLSSTPFDRIPAEDRAQVATAMDVLSGPNGSYLVAGLIRSYRKTTDRYGRPMAFMTLTTERGELSVTIFSKEYERYHQYFKTGVLAYVSVSKNSRGQTLDLFVSLDE